MYQVSVAIVILVMLVLIGVISYYVYDYYSYKANVSDSISATNKLIDQEELERRNSVNDLGKDLGNTRSDLTTKLDKTSNEIKDTQADTDLIARNIGRVADFSSGASSYDIMSFPGTGVPDMSLKASVAALNGLTIKDLAGNKKFKVCGAGDNPNCIEIPDDDGNVYLTPLTSDKSVSIDGRTAVSGVLSIKENRAAAVPGAEIVGKTDGSSFIKTEKLGVGNVSGSPNASLHVMTSGAVPFKITSTGASGTADVLSVDSTGIVAAKSIKIKNPGDQDSDAFSIGKDTDGNLAITAPVGKKVVIAGDVKVTGGVSYTGALQQVSTFTSGPIKMKGGNIMTPADYMNSPYLISAH